MKLTTATVPNFKMFNIITSAILHLMKMLRDCRIE